MRVTRQAHEAVRAVVERGETVIDATAGNGHDTLFLAECVGGKGRVIGFDVQAAAIAETRRRLDEAGVGEGVAELWQEGHEKMAELAPGPVAAVMFNLGYLPGGDHALVTEAETTVAALGAAADLLRPGGILTVVCYPDHPGGGVEAGAVKKWAESLDPRAFHWGWSLGAERNRGPRLLVVNKLGKSTC